MRFTAGLAAGLSLGLAVGLALGLPVRLAVDIAVDITVIFQGFSHGSIDGHNRGTSHGRWERVVLAAAPAQTCQILYMHVHCTPILHITKTPTCPHQNSTNRIFGDHEPHNTTEGTKLQLRLVAAMAVQVYTGNMRVDRVVWKKYHALVRARARVAA